MSLDELRKRQYREVLDVWNDVSRRVQERQFQQVKQFDEAVLPKKTRDLEAEQNADRTIQSLNKLVEVKVVALENLIDFLDRFPEKGAFEASEFRKLFTSVTLNQDFISNWNSFVRVYRAPAVSKQSIELIKVKLEELTPNITALNYGMQQLLDYFFENGEYTAKNLFSLMQSYALFREVKRQIDTSNFVEINLNTIERSLQNIIAEQPQARQERIKLIWNKSVAQGDPLSSAILRGRERIEEAELIDRRRQEEADTGRSVPSSLVPIGALEYFPPVDIGVDDTQTVDVQIQIVKDEIDSYERNLEEAKEEKDSLSKQLKRTDDEDEKAEIQSELNNQSELVRVLTGILSDLKQRLKGLKTLVAKGPADTTKKVKGMRADTLVKAETSIRQIFMERLRKKQQPLPFDSLRPIAFDASPVTFKTHKEAFRDLYNRLYQEIFGSSSSSSSASSSDSKEEKKEKASSASSSSSSASSSSSDKKKKKKDGPYSATVRSIFREQFKNAILEDYVDPNDADFEEYEPEEVVRLLGIEEEDYDINRSILKNIFDMARDDAEAEKDMAQSSSGSSVESEDEPLSKKSKSKKGKGRKESFLAQLSNKPLRGTGEDRTTLQKLDFNPDMITQFLPHYRRRLPFGFNDDRNDFFNK